MKTFWVILWSLWAARLVRQPTLPVKVTGGWLRGDIAHDGSHKKYLAVPYASYPVKRFLAPGPEPKWRGVFEAIEENIRCLQKMGDNMVVGDEECLILNIYTPVDTDIQSKYPVMVFIHGGGFFQGSGSSLIYKPDYLIKKNIILVTINYRLHIEGFACLRIKDAPGNAGMKDQVAALRWIQRNIEQFGGDPTSVTLFGESAGGASVSFHILSPMSKGLFHKAIIQSGSAVSSWAIQFKPVFMASLLTKAMGYTTEDPNEIYNVLVEKSKGELLLTRVPRPEHNVIVSEILYTPCVEVEIEDVEPFLTDFPYNLFKKGKYNKVPIIIGYNNEEGLLLSAFENDTTISQIVFEKSLPKSLDLPKEKRKEVGDRLTQLYLGDKDMSLKNIANISKIHGEPYIIVPILEETELYLDTNDKPVYSYIFRYNGWRNIPKNLIGKDLREVPGATHADDLFYLFKPLFIPSLFEDKMIDRLTTMWTYFAKYGDPIPDTSDLLPMKWLPANRTSPHSFVIDEEFSTAPFWMTESLKYLREVFVKYRRKKD